MGAFACKEGSRIDIPNIEGRGAFLIYLPSECEGGAISLSFDEREPIIFETAVPNELSTIVWFQEVEYHHAPVRKDSQGVLLYRLTRDDSAPQFSAIGPVTRNQLSHAFQQLSAQDSEVQYFVWSEESATIEGAIEVPQACAERTCHCFLARPKRRMNEGVPSYQYFLDELQCLTGLGVLTVPELHVSGDFLRTKRWYSGSSKMEKTVLENRDVEYCDIQILVVVTQQRLVSFLCPRYCSEPEALKLLQQLSEGPQLELARSICQQIRHPFWLETWSGPLLVTAVRLGELVPAYTIGQQLKDPLDISTPTALGQQYQISEDSSEEMRLDKVHWQCIIRLEGQGHHLQVSYYALKAFFAGMTGLSQN